MKVLEGKWGQRELGIPDWLNSSLPPGDELVQTIGVSAALGEAGVVLWGEP